MTDDPRPDDAAAEATATAEEEPQGPKKLTQTVEANDIGPCKKHVKVTVDRAAIDERLHDKFNELVKTSFVAGFRPGKAPAKLVQKRYHNEVSDQVKTEVLLASLEQLAEEADIAPLSAPNIDPGKIELPKEGPFVYEFDVEVRPSFDLPEYKGLKLKRPIYNFTDADLEREMTRLLRSYGQLIPKENGTVAEGDVVTSDLAFTYEGKPISEAKEIQIRVEKQLAIRDGLGRDFGAKVSGAKTGEKRVVDVELSSQAANPELRGKIVQMTMDIKDIKTSRLPELTEEFLDQFGVKTPEALRELVKVALDRKLEHTQRQWARQQVTQHIAAASTWDLPQDLLVRQARKALARRVMEMRSDGMSDEDIQARQRVLQQNILQSTALALKEHFVLQKIAEVEKIEVSDEDLEAEIERMADQSGESARRVRAQLEREDMLDAVAAEMIERKVLDVILETATYEDVPVGDDLQQENVSTAEVQTVPGEMRDMDAEAAASAAAEAQPPA